MPVEHDFDYCARRAAEEFVAANRSQTAEQRKHHRQLAEQYADLVRAMMLARNGPEPAWAAGERLSLETGDKARAA